MKIFSLESKTSLVVWSLVAGLVIGSYANTFIVNSVCKEKDFQPRAQKDNSAPQELTFEEDACIHGLETQGYPFKHEIYLSTLLNPYPQPDPLAYIAPELYNYIFWILISFIILSIIRYFRNKNKQITVKQR